MRGGERVVDIDIGKRRELPREPGIVGFLTRMEPQVLQQRHIAVLHRANHALGGGAHTIGCERHGPADRLGQWLNQRGQGHLGVRLTLWAAVMGGDDHPRALVDEFGDSGGGALNSRGVGDLAVLHGHVQIDAQKHPLARHIQPVQCPILDHHLTLHHSASARARSSRVLSHKASVRARAGFFVGVTYTDRPRPAARRRRS